MPAVAAPRPPPLLQLSRPMPATVATLVQQHHASPLSYDLEGGTRGTLPVGWRHDDRSVPLGDGDVWGRAREALDRWVQFDLGWVRMEVPAPLEAGNVVAFASRQLGLWAINLCRIVYVVDRDDAAEAVYGFAYGTLESHAVSGEELFMLRHDKAADEVRFRIAKFSRLSHPLVRLAAPLAHHLQDRFTTHALERMRVEVTG
ncbi:MAG: hypothetical protein ACI8PZ_004903 [Myxococcota bacterium]|jgi:uncharacterized protein (UPF0548 family)